MKKKRINKIKAEGVCIEKKARKATKGKANQVVFLPFFIASIKNIIAIREKIYECRYANGVPETG